MATEKRKMSTAAKVITALIYLLAIALLAVVIYLNLHGTGNNPVDVVTNKITEKTTVSTTVELPYNEAASDKYANIEPLYNIADVSIEKDGNDIWSAFVNGKKAEDYTGVARNEHGWFFVRDGEVDFHYNGIAGNEVGNWYVKNGKVDFSYTGNFQVNNTSYKVVEGQVIE